MKEKFSKGQAWVDLIFQAAWKAHKVKDVFLERGQLWTTERFLAKRWRWSQEKVGRFLADLLSRDMVFLKRVTNGQKRVTKHGSQGTLIEIRNYNKYQDVRGLTKKDRPQIEADVIEKRVTKVEKRVQSEVKRTSTTQITTGATAPPALKKARTETATTTETPTMTTTHNVLVKVHTETPEEFADWTKAGNALRRRKAFDQDAEKNEQDVRRYIDKARGLMHKDCRRPNEQFFYRLIATALYQRDKPNVICPVEYAIRALEKNRFYLDSALIKRAQQEFNWQEKPDSTLSIAEVLQGRSNAPGT